MTHGTSHFNDVIISKVLFTVINASVFTIFNCNHPYLQPYFTKFLLSIAKISTNHRTFNERERLFEEVLESKNLFINCFCAVNTFKC